MITTEWPAHAENGTAPADSDGSACDLASSFDHDKVLKSRTFDQKRIPNVKTHGVIAKIEGAGSVQHLSSRWLQEFLPINAAANKYNI